MMGRALPSHDNETGREAVALILYQVMVADGRIRPAEVEFLGECLSAQFDLSPDECDRAIESVGRALRYGGLELNPIRHIVARFDENERLELVRNFWRMAAADGEIHELEESLISRIAEMLDVDAETVAQLRPLTVFHRPVF